MRGERGRRKRKKNTKCRVGLNLRQRRGITQEKGHNPLVRLSGSETLEDM